MKKVLLAITMLLCMVGLASCSVTVDTVSSSDESASSSTNPSIDGSTKPSSTSPSNSETGSSSTPTSSSSSSTDSGNSEDFYYLNTSVNDTDAGKVTEFNNSPVGFGSSITVKATSNAGYEFVGWYEGNEQISLDKEFTFDMPDRNVNLEAKWNNKNFIIKREDGVFKLTGIVNKNVKKIVIPDYIISIENLALAECDMAEEIIIPDSVIKIGIRAFKNCKSLKSITIPKSVEYIGYHAFEGCYKLVEIYNLTSNYTLSNDDTYIYKSYPISLFGPGLVFIDNPIIEHKSLDEKSVIIKDKNGFEFVHTDSNYFLIDYLGDNQKIELPTGFVYDEANEVLEYDIGVCAFYGKTSIKEIIIPNTVKSIGSYAFAKCASLTNVLFPNISFNIGGYIFDNCVSLMSLKIPASLNNGSLELGLCPKLYEIYNLSSCHIVPPTPNTVIYTDLREGTSLFTDEEGFVFSCLDNNKGTLLGYVGDKTEIVLPTSVEINGNIITNYSIGRYAFSYSNITSVLFNDSVTAIEEFAFSYCKELNNFSLPNSITRIGYRAFYGCDKITKVIVPSTVVELGYDVFEDCANLQEIIIHKK